LGTVTKPAQLDQAVGVWHLVTIAGFIGGSLLGGLLVSMLLMGTGLAFISVPQSALFIQEAPSRYIGSVTAFRTTTGQFGFALGFATSGAMVNGFSADGLHERLLKLGFTGVQHSELEARLRAALASGSLSHAKGLPAKTLQVMAESYASGLAGTMVLVAVLVGLLGAISLLVLVIGHQQRQAELGARA
jgi:hypothetical protein